MIEKVSQNITIPDFIEPDEYSIYIGGPMRGYPRFNFEAFDAAAERLRTCGWDVRSPSEHDVRIGFDPDRPFEDQEYNMHEAFRWDVAQLAVCQALYLLEGWKQSSGAAGTEYPAAVSCGLVIIEEEEDLFPRIDAYLGVKGV